MNLEANAAQLLIVRLLAASREASRAAPATYEFELRTTGPITGILEMGPFRLEPWDRAALQHGEPCSLVLRIENYTSEASTEPAATRKGHHGFDAPDEICALLSVGIGRHVARGPLVRLNHRPVRVFGRGGPLQWGQHRAVGLIRHSENSADLSAIVSWFERVVKLPPKLQKKLILACRMYQEALLTIDDQPDLAYLRLVSAIEVFVSDEHAREEDLPAEIRNALDTHPDEASRKLLLRKLLEDRGISKRFVTFAVEHLDEHFWSASRAKAIDRVRPDEIADVLRKIYNQRSRTLHAGEPFPPHVMNAPDDTSEILRRESGLVDGSKVWAAGELIPYVSFFERVVRHVLLRFPQTSHA